MKKGFTLVELLAVIIILALIIMIVAPKVSKTIDNASRKSEVLSVKALAKSAEEYYGQYRLDNTIKNNIDNGGNLLQYMEFKGKAPESGDVRISETGEVEVYAEFDGLCYHYTEADGVTSTSTYTTCATE